MNYVPVRIILTRSLRLTVLFFLAISQSIFAQEIKQLSTQPSFTTADTAYISSLMTRGAALRWKNSDSAMRLFYEGVMKSRELNYIDGIGFSLTNMGVIAQDQGKYELSLSLFHQALPYCLQAVYTPHIAAKLYNNIGNVYFAYGHYANAAYYYYTAVRALGSDTLAPMRISFYNNLGAIHIRLGQEAKGLSYLQMGEKLARKMGDFKRLSFTLNNKGEAYMSLKQYGRAQAEYLEGLKYARLGEDQDVEQSIGVSLGDLMLRTGKPVEALMYLKQALVLLDKKKANAMMIHLFYQMGLAYAELGKYHQALEYLLPAIDSAEKLGVWDNLPEAHASLATAYEGLGRYGEALAHQRVYSDLKDSLFNEKNTRSINQLEIKYRTSEKDREITENQLVIVKQQNQLSKKNTLIWIISLSAVMLTLLVFLLLSLYRNNQYKQRRQEEQIRLMEQGDELRIIQALMKGEEMERTRLARELHDGIGGMLAAIQMHCSATSKRRDEHAQARNMSEIMRLLNEVIDEVRKTAHNLMPDVLLRHSLTQALQLYCDQINSGDKLHIDLQIYGIIGPMSKSVELTLYRIVQELLQNIIKHAGADQVVIQINQQEQIFGIMIEDNGIGFDFESVQGGFGLQNLKSRVGALQGFMTIESGSGRGTITYITFDTEKLKITA